MDEKINILAEEYLEQKNNIVMNIDGGMTEMIRITPDGFYVRGVKVEQGPEEASAVYRGFKEMLAWHTLKK